MTDTQTEDEVRTERSTSFLITARACADEFTADFFLSGDSATVATLVLDAQMGKYVHDFDVGLILAAFHFRQSPLIGLRAKVVEKSLGFRIQRLVCKMLRQFRESTSP